LRDIARDPLLVHDAFGFALLRGLTVWRDIVKIHDQFLDVGCAHAERSGRQDKYKGETMSPQGVASRFSSTYAEAREKFLAAANAARAGVVSHVLPGKVGAHGETLAMDVAYLGEADAARVFIVSSGTHGAEGYCGSGCQVDLLSDTQLLDEIASQRLGLLMIHAVNPYGFSWMHRTNEDNIDLNRNAVTFPVDQPLDPNFEIAQNMFLPGSWPRTPEQQRALDEYCRERGGLDQVWKILSKGQYGLPDGVFYGGAAPSWSVLTVRKILEQYVRQATHTVWVDVHTGLGPYGHGEKICPGRVDDREFVARLWGSDIQVPALGKSLSGGVSGPVLKMIYDVCPQVRAAIMALEFGTQPYEQVLDSLVADSWLQRQTEVSAELKASITQQLRDAFYCDADDWKGSVLGQARVIFLQSIRGLASA
jgi:hypothetical protein